MTFTPKTGLLKCMMLHKIPSDDYDGIDVEDDTLRKLMGKNDFTYEWRESTVSLLAANVWHINKLGEWTVLTIEGMAYVVSVPYNIMHDVLNKLMNDAVESEGPAGGEATGESVRGPVHARVEEDHPGKDHPDRGSWSRSG